MRFDEAVKGLTVEEVAALRTLEAAGWQLGLDVRVEDMTKPDGERRRTFSNRGRYSVAAFLKNLSGRDRVEFPAFTPELIEGIKPPPVVPEVVVQEEIPEEIPEVVVPVVEAVKPIARRPVPWIEEDVKPEKKHKEKAHKRGGRR